MIGKTLPYDSLDALRARMAEANPVFDAIDEAIPAEWQGFGEGGPIDPWPFASPVENFYMTDPISRASITMAQCSELHAASAGKTGTDG